MRGYLRLCGLKITPYMEGDMVLCISRCHVTAGSLRSTHAYKPLRKIQHAQVIQTRMMTSGSFTYCVAYGVSEYRYTTK